MLLYGMREVFGQVAFAVAILISATGEVSIAVIANMLAIHALVLTRHLHPALIAPEVTVIIIAVTYLLIAFIAIMLGSVLVRTVNDSVTAVAIVVFVLVYVIANELVITFVTVSVAIIIAAPYGNPYSAVVANVIIVIVCVVGIIGIFLTFSFLATDVTSCVSILVDMLQAHQLIATLVAEPIAVGIYAQVRHPAAALVTVMIAVIINMIFA